MNVEVPDLYASTMSEDATTHMPQPEWLKAVLIKLGFDAR